MEMQDKRYYDYTPFYVVATLQKYWSEVFGMSSKVNDVHALSPKYPSFISLVCVLDKKKEKKNLIPVNKTQSLDLNAFIHEILCQS